MEEADDSAEEASGMVFTAVFAEVVAARGRGIGLICLRGRKLRYGNRLAAEFISAVGAVNNKL